MGTNASLKADSSVEQYSKYNIQTALIFIATDLLPSKTKQSRLCMFACMVHESGRETERRDGRLEDYLPILSV